jgi:hypothetical protein
VEINLMPATKAAAAVGTKQEQSRAGKATATAPDARVKRDEYPRRKSPAVRKAVGGSKRRKEEAKQRNIIADCIKRIDETLKRMARDEEEVRRLREETRAVLSRL